MPLSRHIFRGRRLQRFLRQAPAWSVCIRRTEVSARFHPFRLCEPRRAQRGTFTLAPSNWVWNQNTQTFNTLNTFTFKGDAPPRMELTFDSLMTSALDEPDSVYCLLADSVTLSEDRRSYLFSLRKEARFHDGSPVEAKDVVFSYMTIKEKDTRTFGNHLQRWKRQKQSAHIRYDCTLPKAVARKLFSMPSACLFSQQTGSGIATSILQVWSQFWDQALIAWERFQPGSSSNMSACMTIGPRICRSHADRTISTAFALNSIRIANRNSKPSKGQHRFSI